MPCPASKQQSVGLGSVEFLVDRDGILRSLPVPYTEIQDGGGLQNRRPPVRPGVREARVVPGPGAGGARWTAGTTSSATTCTGRRGTPGGSPSTAATAPCPAYRLRRRWLRGAALPDLKGTVVLMGYTRPSLHDFFSVPLPRKTAREYGIEEIASNTMAGVEIHGQALSALLQEKSIVPLGASWRWSLFGILAALGIALIVLHAKPMFSARLWLTVLVAFAGSAVAAIRSGTAIPAFALAVTLFAFLTASFGYHRYLDFQERQAVERLFSRYVSPNIARKLLKNPDLVHLGGRRKVLTVLFSDIRGFTSLSEQIPPEQVSGLLNEYFTEMVKVLFNFDGTLDKFIGDAILAFFGDPIEQLDHSARALSCAVAMQEAATSLEGALQERGQAGAPRRHLDPYGPRGGWKQWLREQLRVHGDRRHRQPHVQAPGPGPEG